MLHGATGNRAQSEMTLSLIHINASTHFKLNISGLGEHASLDLASMPGKRAPQP